MRIRGAKSELEEAGESTEGMVESTATLREEILALSGVDIMKNANEFKSTYAIMDELANKWEGLSDIAQATIIEKIAGKHQGNVFSSLMANFDTARKALETSANSSGSAMAEHAKWSDSLEARLNKLKATWQSLSQSFMSSDFLKGGISAITSFVDTLDGLISKFGTLPTLFTGFTLFNSLFNKDSALNLFKTFNTDLDGFINKAGIASKSFAEITQAFKSGKSGSGIKGFLTGLSSVGNIFKNTLSDIDISNIQAYNNLIDEGVTAQTAWNRTMHTSSDAAKNIVAGANGGKVAMQGLTAATNTSKIAMLGLSLAATAMNAAITMGLSALISWGIKELDEWVVTADELAEKVDDVTTKYKDQHSELMKLKGDYDTTNEDSMISKYEELSKGVDPLGENVSLTADEYAEYQDIVNQIASTNPDLVAGYNSQGQAILKYADNIDMLSESYKDLIRAENDAIIGPKGAGRDILKDFENDLKNTSAYYETIKKNADGTDDPSETIENFDLKHLDELERLMNLSGEALNSALENLSVDEIDRLSRLLEEQGIERDKLGSGEAGWENKREHVVRALQKNRADIKDVLDGAKADFDAYAEEMGLITDAYLSDAFLGDYANMSERMQGVISQATSMLGADFYTQFAGKDNGYELLTGELNSILTAFNSMSDEDAAQFEAAFDLKTKFNGGDISYGEYVNGLQETGQLIDELGLAPEITSQIKLSLGLNEEGFVDQYQTMLNRLTKTNKDEIATGNIIGLNDDEAKELLDDLSAQELSVLTKIIPELDVNATREEIESAIDREMVLSGLIFDLNLEVEAAGIESLNTALAESVTASGLSSESISALKSRYSDLEAQGYDLSSMFEETSHGIHLNRNELSKLENELSKQKLTEVNNDLERMKNEYDRLGEAIKNCEDPLQKSKLFDQRQSLAQKISDAATLASQYQGLTSAYNQWLAAEEAGSERNMYENVISGFETVKDEISRGWIDDGTIAFLEMLTGKTDLAGKSGKELKDIYDSLDDKIKDTTYSVKDFFTVDENGNSTSKGVYNFLDAIGQLEEEVFGYKDVIKRDDEENIIGFDFELAGGDKAIADALGISEELVQIMVRAADDAGFVISMDGTYRQLADLQNEAKAAADYLKEIGKTDFEFDFNTSNVENLRNQLEEAKNILADDSFWNKDGTFNFNADGATEAMQIVSTLQAKIDNLTQEKYGIGLTVEDKKFEEPLEKLQEYGRTIAELNQLNLNPKANAVEIEQLEGKLDTIAQDLIDLSENSNIDIGIEAGDDVEAVKEKIANGEIKIPTTLDIQANMDKNLSDLRDLALLNSGLLSEEQERAIKVRLGIEVETDESSENEFQSAIDGIVAGGSKVVVQSDVEIEPTSVDTSNITEEANNEAQEGADGHLSYRFGKVIAEADSVDTSGVTETAEETIQEESGSEPVTLNQNVQLEFDINDYIDELSRFKDIATELEGLEDITVTITANFEGSLKDSNDVDKLATFAQGAKELQGVWNKDNSVTVTATFTGNLGEAEGIEKLKTFAEGAKALQDVRAEDDIELTVTANYEGGLSQWKGDINDLVEFANSAKVLDSVGKEYITVTLTTNISGTAISDGGAVQKLKNFVELVNELEGKETVSVDVKASVDTDNINKAIEYLQKLADNEELFKNYNSTVTIDTQVSGYDDALNLEQVLTRIKEKENINIVITLEGADAAKAAIERLTNALKGLGDVNINLDPGGGEQGEGNAEGQTTTGTINYELGDVAEPSGQTAEGTINYDLGDVAEPSGQTAEGTINYGAGTVEEPESQTTEGSINYESIVPPPPAGLEGSGEIAYENIVPPPPTGLQGSGTIVYTASFAGLGPAAGTAHSSGSAFADGTSGRAFARGDWGIKGNGVALGGELGQELVVRDGKFFTIGDNGAEFFRYKKNDIVFNAAQTESLFKYGGIKGANPRGKMLASGTAFATGNAFAFPGSSGHGGLNPDDEEKNYSSGQSAPSESSSSGDDGGGNENEVFDWFEKLLDRFDRAIDMLDKAANNIYKSFDSRNASLSDEIAKVTEQIANQQKAYERYIAEAESVGSDVGFDIGDDFREKLRNGDFSIDVVSDDQLIDNIKRFEEWYEKALECEEAIQELEETLSSLYAQKLDIVAAKYEGILGIVEHEKNILEGYISQSEAQAWLISSEYYDALINNERENIVELKNEKAEMIAAYNEAMASGTIEKNSEAWYNMIAQIDEVTLAIQESETAILEYSQELQQLHWEVFDLLQDKISSVTDETEFLINLLGSKELHDDNGQLTKEGLSTMGLHGVAYNAYMHQADLAAEEIARLKDELDKDPFDTELEERYREMVELQQDYILSAQDEKEAIRDLVEEGINLEIEALEERIDKYNEAIESQKDLYDYQKRVKEQTEDIASLRKQLSAYEGFDDEETKAKIQELKVSLEEAEAELEETEYDRYISDTQQMLDDLVLEYSEILNGRLDNVDYLVEQMIAEINSDASIIGDTIRETVDSVGYTLTESMQNIWDENAISTKNVITTYGDKFANAQTTTNSVLNAINTNLQNMIAQLGKDAESNVKSASTSSFIKTSDSKTPTETTTNNNSTGDKKPKIGDRVKYVDGQYYYDSQGKKPLGSHNKGEYVYITNINKKDWATHGYHISTGNKLGKGDLGWLKLNQISGYSDGKKNFLNNEIAWTQENGEEFIIRPSDGAILTPIAKSDSVLTSAASRNIWDFANSPAEFIKDNLNIGSASVPNNSNSYNNYTQHLDKVVFNFPNVKNYEQFLSAMQKDKNFERLIHSMTIDQIAGKSSLRKGKSIK